MSLKQAILFYQKGDLKHCLEIIRQAIMCDADLSLNSPHVEAGTQLSSGWGGIQMCRDWNKVFKAVLSMWISRHMDGWLDTSEKP